MEVDRGWAEALVPLGLWLALMKVVGVKRLTFENLQNPPAGTHFLYVAWCSRRHSVGDGARTGGLSALL